MDSILQDIRFEFDRWDLAYSSRQTLARVGAPVQLHTVEEADHTFRVAKKGPRNPEDVQELTYVYIKYRSLSAVFTQLTFALMGFFQGRLFLLL